MDFLEKLLNYTDSDVDDGVFFFDFNPDNWLEQLPQKHQTTNLLSYNIFSLTLNTKYYATDAISYFKVSSTRYRQAYAIVIIEAMALPYTNEEPFL